MADIRQTANIIQTARCRLFEKETSETEAKVDTIIKARFDESLREENKKAKEK